MNARPTDVLYTPDLRDFADIETEEQPPSTAQERFDAALLSLMRFRRAERDCLNNAARLATLARYAEIKIEIALADGAVPCEVRRG